MITVDDREGSKDLYPLLAAKGLPVQLGRMTFGDVYWIGTGPGQLPVTVGIEHKDIRDVLKCMTDGRFAGHQLPGMMQTYDQPWLLIEGNFRARHPDGILEIMSNHGMWYEASVGQRRFMYRDLLTWIFTIQIKGGIQIAIQSSSRQTAVWLSALYNWWQDYDKHGSHLSLNLSGDTRTKLADRAVLVRPSLLRMVAKELPGVGFEKSGDIAKFFGSVENLCNATVDDLRLVPGIGEGLARKIHDSIREVRR